MVRQAKVWISAVYWLLFLSWRGALWRAGLLRHPKVVVLLYHGIQKSEQAKFKAQMHTLLRLARPINLDGPENGQVAETGNGRPSTGLDVGVTFDDGFVSMSENAIEVLQSLNIHAVLFVPVASMGKTPGWWAGADATEMIMNEDQLRALPSGLISIASHSMTHPHLLELDNDMLRWELVHSREVLEQVTGRPVRLFSYPYGEWSPRVKRAAHEAGYEKTFTITPSLSLWGTHVPWGSRSLVGRVCVEPSDGPIEFKLKLVGAYEWMPWASRIKRALKTLVRSRFARKEAEPLDDHRVRTGTKN